MLSVLYFDAGVALDSLRVVALRVPSSTRNRIAQKTLTPPEKVRPRTTLLRVGLPRAYFVHEEEVPRAGALITQSYQRTRWIDGRALIWFGARKQTGRGEGSSGLRFDALVDTTRV
jgi:hypothetical protein